MHLPSITATYLGILALLYLVLGLQVSRLRRGHRVLFGDGDNIKLRSAIRAHANFAEYVPIIVLMVAMLEMSGMQSIRVHLLMAALLVEGCCIRSACMWGREPCSFKSAGSAASCSRCWSCFAPLYCCYGGSCPAPSTDAVSI